MPRFSDPEWKTLFDDLLFDLRRKSCVLMIGPDIVEIEGEPIQKHLSRVLLKEHREDIEHYYEKESLFLFKGPLAKSKVQRGVSKYYDRLKPDPTIFEVISATPFRLIISINPDSFLEDTLRSKSLPFFSAYFNHDAKSNGEQGTEDWDSSTPLVYNLCGSTDRDASLLLDYDDLFSFLKSVLGAVGLPNHIRGALRKAKSFLFVGFQFDKWYTQLLLRLLNEDNAPTQLALNTQLGDKDTQHFLLKRFNMQFLGVPSGTDSEGEGRLGVSGAEFLKELTRRWQATQAAQGEDLSKPNKDLVRRLTEKGELEQALDTLKLIVSDPEDRDMVTMLQNWFHTWKREQNKGAEDSRTLDNRYNKILNGLLEQLKNLS